jgi:uncharacterized DUF497 family protein
MAQFEFVAWLIHWILSQEDFEFEWDRGNELKNFQKHGVEVDSAEQVFRNRDCLVPLGIQVVPSTNEPRFGALGMDLLGNRFFVSFTIREGRIRIISIRPMSQFERNKYAQVREK